AFAYRGDFDHGFAPERRVLGDRQLLLATRSARLGIAHGRYVPGHDDVSVRETWIRPARRAFGDHKRAPAIRLLLTPPEPRAGVPSGFLGVPRSSLRFRFTGDVSVSGAAGERTGTHRNSKEPLGTLRNPDNIT